MSGSIKVEPQGDGVFLALLSGGEKDLAAAVVLTKEQALNIAGRLSRAAGVSMLIATDGGEL